MHERGAEPPPGTDAVSGPAAEAQPGTSRGDPGGRSLPTRQRARQPSGAGPAIAWAVVFGGLHLAWATGSRVGLLDAAAADRAFQQPWFRLYNLSVVLGCLALACAVVGLASQRRRVRRACGRFLLLAGIVLVVRGGIGGLQLASSTLTADRTQPVAAWWPDGLMLLGGLLLLRARRGRS